MKIYSVAGRLQPDFKILGGTDRSQAATMVVGPHAAAGSDHNFHESCDQWILVLAGSGKALVAKREVALARGTLVLIEAGEVHEVRNTSDEPMSLLTFYAPPAY